MEISISSSPYCALVNHTYQRQKLKEIRSISDVTTWVRSNWLDWRSVDIQGYMTYIACTSRALDRAIAKVRLSPQWAWMTRLGLVNTFSSWTPTQASMPVLLGCIGRTLRRKSARKTRVYNLMPSGASDNRSRGAREKLRDNKLKKIAFCAGVRLLLRFTCKI